MGSRKKVYDESTRMKDIFRVLSVHRDNNGTRFISAYEAKKYPIIALQFHPEKIQFEWKVETSRIPEAVDFSSYLSRKFVAMCRNSSNHFPEHEFQRLSIHNFHTVNNNRNFSQIYVVY